MTSLVQLNVIHAQGWQIFWSRRQRKILNIKHENQQSAEAKQSKERHQMIQIIA